MIRHHTWLVAAGALACFSVPTTAAPRPRSRGLDANVRQVQSASAGDRVYRAVVSLRGVQPTLTVEILGARRRWRQFRVLVSTPITAGVLASNRRRVDLSPATTIDLRGWSQSRGSAELQFAVNGPGGRYRCRVSANRQSVSGALCQGQATHPLPQPLPPPPPQPQPQPVGHNYAGDPQVIRACGNAVYGQQNRTMCLAAVFRVRTDPTRMIAACDKSIYGDAATLDCIKLGAASHRDISPAIIACDAATTGNTNTLACVRAAGALGPYIAVIAACDQAMVGDPNTLSCIQIASRIRGRNPVPTIRSCAESMVGDSAALACLNTAAGRYRPTR